MERATVTVALSFYQYISIVNYRKKEHFTIVRIPEAFIEADRGKLCGSCCKDQLVLADAISTDTHKNDFTGVYLKKGIISDSIVFTMEDCDENVVSNQGEDATFPNDNLAVGYIFDWQKILNTHGVGKYNIKVDFTIAGVTGDFIVGTYELKNFSFDNTRDTVRIYSEFNTYYQRDNVDFTESNFKDTVRFNGFFGHRQPKTEINNLIDKGRTVLKVTRENLNNYTLSYQQIL